jgi:3-oxoacyl-(acyl-carrier-protein) synthase
VTGRVAVAGLGCVSSIGSSASAFTDALLAGRCGVRTLTEFPNDTLRSPRAARVVDFDAAAIIPPLKLRRVDEVGRITIGAVAEALEASGYPRRSDGYSDIGLALGSVTAGVHASAEYLKAYLEQGGAAAPALIFSNTVGNAAASTCALEFGLRGPNTTLTGKEASGLAAVAFGAHLVRRRKTRAVVAGGADVLEWNYYRVHDWFETMAPGEDAVARPFDRDRDGFVMGEGAFLFVLEDAAALQARGRRPLGIIHGAASGASTERMNAWPTDKSALVRVMREALARAGVPADRIAVVYASANGTTALDRIESEAIGEVFGAGGVPVASVKGALGESGATGAASLAAALLCGARGQAPPTVGLKCLAEDCPVDAAPDARRLAGRVALINGFASGGTLVSLVVETA